MILWLLSILSFASPLPDGAERLTLTHDDLGVQRFDEEHQVIAIIEGSAAWNAGVRPGHRLISINARPVAKMSPAERNARLLHEATQLEFADGGTTLGFDLERVSYDPLNQPVHTMDGVQEQAWWCAEGNCADGKGKATHSSGLSYVGAFQDGTPHGYGTWLAADKTRFDGNSVHGQPSGPGAFRSATGDTFAGTWVDGLANGEFTAAYQSGESYEGTLVDTLPHGQGQWQGTAGLRYIGEFVYGKFQGQGDLTLGSGERYVGRLHRGIAHGEGRLVLAAGDVLEGTFLRGQLEGPGRRTWSDDGREYEGEFRRNAPHGSGTLTFTDGRTHTGTFVEGDVQGLGTQRLPNDRVVVGQFASETRCLGYIVNGTGDIVYRGWIVRGRAEGWGAKAADDGWKRDRFYFNDKPRGDHPRTRQTGVTEKEAYAAFDWTTLDELIPGQP